MKGNRVRIFNIIKQLKRMYVATYLEQLTLCALESPSAIVSVTGINAVSIFWLVWDFSVVEVSPC